MDHTHDQSPQSNDPADKAHNTPPRSRFGFPKSGGDEDRQAVNAGETKPEEKSKKKIISILATIALFIFGAICANFLMNGGLSGASVSKEDYAKGLRELIVPTLPAEMPDELVDSIMECLADRTFDQVSGTTKKNVAEGVDEVSERDVVLFSTYSEECANQAVENGGEGE